MGVGDGSVVGVGDGVDSAAGQSKTSGGNVPVSLKLNPPPET